MKAGFTLAFAIILACSSYGQSDSLTTNTTHMKKYGLHGYLKANQGKTQELVKIMIKASELVSTAEGCQLYVVGIDDSEPKKVWITEIWNSKEEHDNSLQIPAVRELIKEAMPLIDGPPEKGQQLSILGGFGID